MKFRIVQRKLLHDLQNGAILSKIVLLIRYDTIFQDILQQIDIPIGAFKQRKQVFLLRHLSSVSFGKLEFFDIITAYALLLG